MRETLTFEFGTKEVLNSNNMPKHFVVKGKMAAAIRTQAALAGLERHTDEGGAQLAAARYAVIQEEALLTLEKSRMKKVLNKKSIGLADFDIDAEMEKAFEGKGPAVKSSAMDAIFLFDVFRLTVTVCPPTRRRLDPPNLYPTVKALIDGLTDASWWADDNFMHLVETSFRYGGLSGVKDTFKLILDFEEVADPESYNRRAEVAS